MTTSSKSKNTLRKRRHARVRAKVRGTVACPRLAVYKSNRYVSVQLIDDEAGKTLASANGKSVGGSQGAQAKAVGAAIAKAAKAKGIAKVVFDRGGYKYAGLIKSLADTARENGLIF